MTLADSVQLDQAMRALLADPAILDAPISVLADDLRTLFGCDRGIAYKAVHAALRVRGQV